MEGQLTIFDYLEPTCGTVKDFSWDENINRIHEKLIDLASKYHFQVTKEEWDIWSHIPYLGYRMSLTVRVKKGEYSLPFCDEIQGIVDYAKKRNIEISPFAPQFFPGCEYGDMYIFSTFMDKKRQKIK